MQARPRRLPPESTSRIGCAHYRRKSARLSMCWPRVSQRRTLRGSSKSAPDESHKFAASCAVTGSHFRASRCRHKSRLEHVASARTVAMAGTPKTYCCSARTTSHAIGKPLKTKRLRLSMTSPFDSYKSETLPPTRTSHNGKYSPNPWSVRFPSSLVDGGPKLRRGAAESYSAGWGRVSVVNRVSRVK